MDPIYESYVNEMTMIDQNNFYLEFARYVLDNYDINLAKYGHYLGFYTKKYSKLYRVWSSLEYTESSTIDIKANTFLATTTSEDAVARIAREFDATHRALITIHSGDGIDVLAVLEDAMKNYTGDARAVRYIKDAYKTYKYQDEVLVFNKKSKITKDMIFGWYDAQHDKIVKI